jgi:hypothetical protein
MLIAITILVLSFLYDEYFLCLEKLYRSKYEWVRKTLNQKNNYYYDLNPYN